jgi:ArsR family transcriptional regulator
MAVVTAPSTDNTKKDSNPAPLVTIFKALSDSTRLTILRYLAAQEVGCCSPEKNVCACDLEVVTGLSQPTVSHHMKVLMAAKLVIGEKQEKWVYYRVDPRGFERVRDALPLLGG